MDTKQVIVMRKDLNMRKGKMIAQGSHASVAFLTSRITRYHAEKMYATLDFLEFDPDSLPDAAQEWLESSFKKICVYVNSSEELAQVQMNAEAAGLEVHVIVDKGDTEFHGVPTVTCLAIGPDYSEKIDAITGHLPLL